MKICHLVMVGYFLAVSIGSAFKLISEGQFMIFSYINGLQFVAVFTLKIWFIVVLFGGIPLSIIEFYIDRRKQAQSKQIINND